MFKILDEEKTEVRSNGEWFDSMTFADCLDLAYRSTVARMLERNDFEKRFKEGNPISITEFLYPLMQGYDSVALKCHVELGGTDQKFNLLAGRDMQSQFGQPQQIVIMTPLIEGLDGAKKMSKTAGNYIAVDDTPEDMFGKTMSIQDDLIVKYFTLLTEVDPAEIKTYERALGQAEKHQDPRDPLHAINIKKTLARAIVAEYQGWAHVVRAETYFQTVVQERQSPREKGWYRIPWEMTNEDTPLQLIQPSFDLRAVGVPPDPNRPTRTIGIVDLVTTTSGGQFSKSEARRRVAQGGVSVDGVRVTNTDTPIRQQTGWKRELKTGKRGYIDVDLLDESTPTYSVPYEWTTPAGGQTWEERREIPICQLIARATSTAEPECRIRIKEHGAAFDGIKITDPDKKVSLAIGRQQPLAAPTGDYHVIKLKGDESTEGSGIGESSEDSIEKKE